MENQIILNFDLTCVLFVLIVLHLAPTDFD